MQRDDAASVYHHPSWIRLLCDCYGYRPAVLALADAGGKLTAGLPTATIPYAPGRGRVVALPFSDYLPVLAIDDAARAELVSALVARHTDRNAPPLHLHAPLPPHPGVQAGPTYLRHVVRLGPDQAAMLARCDRTRVRQPLERSLAGDLKVGPSDGIDEYYKLHVATRRRHGALPQPRRFFQLLFDRLIGQGLGEILIARLQGRAIAGTVFVWFRARMEYKYNASDRAYWTRSPNHLLLWHGLVRGLDRGCRLLDLGRTDTHADGLRVFKAAWGGEESTLSYVTIGEERVHRGRSVAHRVAPMLRHLPGGILAAAGRLLYKRFG